MSRPIIVVGDRTDHGGVVITGSPFTDINGKAIARIGDKVTCPQKGHGSVTTIVTGDLTAPIDGSPLARHGDKTACGATLLSSQILTYCDTESSQGGARKSGANASNTSAKAQALAEGQGLPHNEMITVVDENGEPVPNFHYAAHVEGKLITSGITNAQGETIRVRTGNTPRQIALSKRT